MPAPISLNRIALVAVDFGKLDFEASLSELGLLASSAGATYTTTLTGRRQSPDAALFIGSGKADELAQLVKAEDIDLVIFNHALSPAQQRNLERVVKVRVIDRNSLILDIFALRAQSHIGKLQVELAQLQHLATRLVRGWTHLERQKGGIGLRGPGETQLETDRRLLGERVKMLKSKLAKLLKQQATQRRARERRDTFTVSLVGYTNAGKSTLFNSLTKAKAYAADQLFATLDTTSRRLYLPESNSQIVLSDTVGFIRDLPHTLVAAFRATLEETVNADLLLHVVDASSENRDEQIAEVNAVLAEIGADTIPQLLVYNKIDAITPMPSVRVDRADEYGKVNRVLISAKEGLGLSELRTVMGDYAQQHADQIASPQLNEIEDIRLSWQADAQSFAAAQAVDTAVTPGHKQLR